MALDTISEIDQRYRSGFPYVVPSGCLIDCAEVALGRIGVCDQESQTRVALQCS